MDLTSAPASIIPKTKPPYASILEVEAVEMARQLTLFDHKLIRAIRPEELLNKAWEKGRERSPNVFVLNERMGQVILVDFNLANYA